jgi:DNA-binding transcriptional MocR family regulator
MSGEAVGWAFRKVQMDDATAKFVLVAICNYANENDQAWPSHNAIAKLSGLSRRTIQNSIEKLVRWGLISRKRRFEAGKEINPLIKLDLDTSWIVKKGMASRATPPAPVWQEIPQCMAGDSTNTTR